MKILFLAPFGIRPKGTVPARMLPLAAELEKQGHSVTVIAPPYTNPEDSGKIETVKGVRLVNISLPKCGKITGAFIISWRLFKAALSEKADLIHIFKPKGYSGLAAMLVLLLKRLGTALPPLFLDCDDREGRGGMNELHHYSTSEKLVFSLQEWWLTKHARGVTVASRELEKIATAMNLPVKSILYLPNCVAIPEKGDGERVRKRLGIPPDKNLLLLYTRFFEFGQKRLHLLFSEIHRLLPDLVMLVAGEGRNGEEELLMEASVKAGFSGNLVMAGWIRPEETADYIAAADLGVYLMDDTMLNRAKCPAKLAELLSAGLPVAADATGEAVSYIEHGETGILCKPGNTVEMAQAVVLLVNNPAKRLEIGNAARKRMQEKFSWGIYAEKLLDFYSGGRNEKTGN